MPESPSPKLRPAVPAPDHAAPAASRCPYAELDVVSNFSFLRGASHPDELVYRAAELGYRAIAITDINSLAGVVRAHEAAKQSGMKLVIGARLELEDGPDLLAWPMNRAAYGRLCRLLTIGKRRAGKAQCKLRVEDVLELNEGLQFAIDGRSDEGEDRGTKARRHEGTKWGQGEEGRSGDACDPQSKIQNPKSKILPINPQSAIRNPQSLSIANLLDSLGRRLSLAVSALYTDDDAIHLRRASELAKHYGIPLLATNHVHYHDPSRRILQDVLTCVRHTCTIQEAGFRLFPNGERYLKSPEQMHRLFADYPRALARTIEIAEACTFNLDQLRYEYPDEVVPMGKTPLEYLTELAWQGAAARYPDGISEKVRDLIRRELILIAQLKFEPYFLTVYDLVKFARSRGILCQGRGSAANSAVCYCLGVTSVDPARIDLLFERFISAARGEPPDIDIDFEHERREEVLQYIYGKYGRERAGMTAEVITYRGRSAIRDVGKALGLSLDMVDQMAKKLDWWERGTIPENRLRECGLDPSDRTVRQVIDITTQFLGFPRHLSQHVGGMVMTRGPLCELVPIENAAMQDRTVIEWDKDDIDALGILKVDCLGLGMLTCISKAFAMLNKQSPTNLHESPRIEQKELTIGYPGNQEEKARTHYYGTGAPPVLGPFQVSNAHPQPNSFFLASWLPYKSSPEKISEDSCRLVGSHPLELHTIPPEDPAVYDMISNADTVGVFQIESRAQMSMLPRLRPRNFYDLVIEVAIVRPGPIVGQMVHPYLKRRNGEEPITYPSPQMKEVLSRTLGVPLFQEQAMRLAIVGAGFSAAEADQLRRAMAAWKRHGGLDKFRDKFINGMLANGYARDFTEQCFKQLHGFSEYGFPESHAASFALLVYASAWLKRHHPAAFCAALLNSQPMGFYAPAQIIRDARQHGVQLRPADINHSDWDCTLEERIDPQINADYRRLREEPVCHCRPDSASRDECDSADALTKRQWHPDDNISKSALICVNLRMNPPDKSTWGQHGPAVRLGLRQLKGFKQSHADRLVEARHRLGQFTSIDHLQRAAHLPVVALRQLAEADAFQSIGLTRRQALWQTMELKDEQAPLFDEEVGSRQTSASSVEPYAVGREDQSKIQNPKSKISSLNPQSEIRNPKSSSIENRKPKIENPLLPPMPIGQEVMIDYLTTGVSLKRHPISLLREDLKRRGATPAEVIQNSPPNTWVRPCGLVLIRQRPSTASGIVFVTLEDETGIVNLIVRPHIYDRYRAAARHAGLMQAEGYVERQGQVVHVMVKRLFDLSYMLSNYNLRSRDFH